jgi:hypothetical protein
MQLNDIFNTCTDTERTWIENQSNSDATYGVLLAQVYCETSLARYFGCAEKIPDREKVNIDLFPGHNCTKSRYMLEGRKYLNVGYLLNWNSLNTA